MSVSTNRVVQGKVKLVVMVAPAVSVARVADLSANPVRLALSPYLPAAAESAANTSVPGKAEYVATSGAATGSVWLYCPDTPST